MNDRGRRGREWMGDFVHDLRFGARLLRKHRGFSAIALATLGLSIGASTATFSVVNAVLLRPLPFPDAERLVQVAEANPGRNVAELAVSYANYRDWQAQSRSWSALAASTHASVNLLTGADPERLTAQFLTSNALATFGVTPALGRGFLPEEDVAGRARVALLSHHVWTRVYGGDPVVIGRSVTINGLPHTLIGVGPPQLMPSDADVFLPLGQYPWPQADALERRSDRHLAVVGRLKPDVSLAAASAEMSALAGRIERAHPDVQAGWTVRLEPLLDVVVGGDRRRVLFLLLAAVGVLLLIACANLGSLLLVSAARRTRELSVRAALGSSRGRHVRQLLTESLLLCGLGGAAGVLLACGGLAVVRRIDPAHLPRAGEVDVDVRVLLFACVATALAAVLSSLVPALKVSRLDVRAGLQETGRAVSAGRGPLRNTLIVGQLALSIFLLAGAALSLRTLDRLARVDLGFEPERVLTLRVAPSRDAQAFLTALLERLHSRPQVEAAGVTSGPPLGEGRTGNEVFPVDPARIPATSSLRADWRIVSADYFHTLGVPLVKGRVFTSGDDGQAPKVIVVNQAFARLMWGDEDPIGKRVSPGGGSDASTVVGVVGDVRMHDPGTPPAPAYYMSLYRGVPPVPMTLVIRAKDGVDGLGAAVRAEVRALDPSLPVYAVQSGEAMVRRRLVSHRVVAALLGTFAAFALVLAAVGLYGVMAHATAERTREVGIRVALGAQPADVLKALLLEGGALIVFGTAIGLGGAFLASGWAGARGTDIRADDPVAFLVAAGLLMVVSLLACYVPARRALKISPLQALRSE